jgi:hypothetical protein
MGFIFRTIFWLSAAAVILPPGARIGGADVAEYRHLDIEYELRSAALSAWTLVATSADACEENPDLCQSIAALWSKGLETVAAISENEVMVWNEASGGLTSGVKPHKSSAEN